MFQGFKKGERDGLWQSGHSNIKKKLDSATIPLRTQKPISAAVTAEKSRGYWQFSKRVQKDELTIAQERPVKKRIPDWKQ